MEDGDFRLFESAVMCVYIASKNPEAGLVPTDGTRERALHDQWVSFVISDLDQPLGRITKHTFGYPEGKRSGADIELAREDFKSLALALEDRLPGPYLVGDRFTVADIVLCYSLRWSTMKGLMGEDLLDGTPGLRAYLERHMQRPSFPAELYG
jgi:glutathione S-transferase